jgi:2-methylcitrate dehydratase PrpD
VSPGPLDQLARRFTGWGPAGSTASWRRLDAIAALVTAAGTVEGRAIAGSGGWDGGLLGDVARRVAMTRMTELDDIHMQSCTTPGSVVVPTALTVGAELDVGLAAIDRAIEIGYEAMTRLGAAIDGSVCVYRGVWPTYFCAPFAAAAVVAALLELGPEATSNALGFALTRASGLVSGIAGQPLARWLSVGDGARAGCSAALAARDGFVAAVDLARVGAGAGLEIDESALLDDGGLAIDEVAVKPYPVAKQSLAATAAALVLRELVAVDQVSLIRVEVPSVYAAMIGNPPRAESRLSRVSSARWNVALALVRPGELHDVERRAGVDEHALARIAALVEVVPDSELLAHYPARWPARVVLDEQVELVLDAPGDPPQNGRAAIEAKWAARGLALEELEVRWPDALEDALGAS